MVPVPISVRNSHSSRLVYLLFSIASQYAPRILRRPNGGVGLGFNSTGGGGGVALAERAFEHLAKRETRFDKHDPKSVVFAILIPVLVLSSGLFAGLTLGYMSLDETQLNVLCISGTPEQRKYANKIMPIRKNGHLLLVTLLLANMIVNESLPVIADPILGGGVQSVIVSTVLIVIFAEIIPQSLFTRHGLYLGAKMAGFTKFLIYALGIIAWPVAKLLELVLGPHHGIIYRRGELKELIAMHSSHATHGGDLKTDTVTIIGATLDLQEKVVKQAMTPISDVFMLSIDSKLDYDLLKKICQTGHSRVPVYEEIDVPLSVVAGADEAFSREDKLSKHDKRTIKVKKIIGILLVKQCVLLDPNDATPLRKIPLNKVPFVPNNEPLLGILDKFQEGRSHMAIVSRFSVEKAASVKQAVKRGLTQRLRARVGMGDSDSDTESSDEDSKNVTPNKKPSRRVRLINGLKRKNSDENTEDGETVAITPEEGSSGAALYEHQYDVEKAIPPALREEDEEKAGGDVKLVIEHIGGEKVKKEEEVTAATTATSAATPKKTNHGFVLPSLAVMTNMSAMEQSMPADAVLAKKGAAEFLQGFDPAVMPLGIITLEDVLEELIGEEIYDEFDTQGAHGDPYEVPPPPPPPPQAQANEFDGAPHPTPVTTENTPNPHTHTYPNPPRPGSIKMSGSVLGGQLPSALKGLGFFRTRSAPPVPRDERDGGGGGVSGVEMEMRENRDGNNGKSVRIGGEVVMAGTGTSTLPSTAGGGSGRSGTLGGVGGAGGERGVGGGGGTGGMTIQMPKPVRSQGRNPPPSVILEQHSSVSSSGSTVQDSLTHFPGPSPVMVPSQVLAAATATTGMGMNDEKNMLGVPGPTGGQGAIVLSSSSSSATVVGQGSGSGSGSVGQGQVVESPPSGGNHSVEATASAAPQPVSVSAGGVGTSPLTSSSSPPGPPANLAVSSSSTMTRVPSLTLTHKAAIQVDKTPSSRSASPSPALEAILLDRKRRIVAAAAAAASASGKEGVGAGVGAGAGGGGGGGGGGALSVPPIIVSSIPSSSASSSVGSATGSGGGAGGISPGGGGAGTPGAASGPSGTGAGGGTGGVTGGSSSPSPSGGAGLHPKGTRFKSSPLGSGV